MGLDDKIKNDATEAKGKAKEATGSATGNESLEPEGKGREEREGHLQQLSRTRRAGPHVGEAPSCVSATT